MTTIGLKEYYGQIGEWIVDFLTWVILPRVVVGGVMFVVFGGVGLALRKFFKHEENNHEKAC